VGAAYAGIALELPADFSTTSRSDLTTGTSLPINLTLEVATDEDQDPGTDTAIDGQAVASREVVIGYELDMTMTAPASVTGTEDGNATGPGVTVDLGLEVAANDIDGSEDATTVTIAFTGLPANSSVNGGTLTGSTWTGTLEEANALTLTLPADYSGTITSAITATSPEGVVTTDQTITIAPTSDIEITTNVITAKETDDIVTVRPASAWTATVTDSDGSETLEQITLTLGDLPAGVSFGEVPAGTVTISGGTLTFTGTPEQYAALTLSFPKDYSTESPYLNGTGLLTGTLTATSNEGSNTAPVSLRIRPEGDIGFEGNKQISLAETDSFISFAPKNALLPVATDIDDSESISNVTLSFNGLPAGATYSTGGAFVTTGSTLNFSGTLAQYNALVIRLPKDYSTENLPKTLTGTLSATTNEGGSATDAFNVSVTAEGDLRVTGTGAISLSENDPANVTDEDSTTTAPLQFAPKNAWNGAANDADGSEKIHHIELTLTGLPAGARISLNGGSSFTPLNTSTYSNANLTKTQYTNLIIRLPDDFSTTSPVSTISGSVTFVTDEAVMAGETDSPHSNTNGIETRAFTVTVTAEADIRITTADVEGIEDTVTAGAPLALNLSAAAVDIDESEHITGVKVNFTGLPDGATVNGGSLALEGGNWVWTGSIAELGALAFTGFPEHYSGVVDGTLVVTTNEGSASESFEILIHPRAEPVLDVTIVADAPAVTQTGDDQYIIKEDTSFLLKIDGSTPDNADGSETLTTIRVIQVPAGWIATDAGGAVDMSIFGGDVAKIASATLAADPVSGALVGMQTLTIELVGGVTDFSGTVRLQPLDDDDRDYATLMQDAAAQLRVELDGLDVNPDRASDTHGTTVADEIEIDYDAVIDNLALNVVSRTMDENHDGRREIDAGIIRIELNDTDGSEVVDKVTLTFTVATESDNFDPSDSINDMFLRIPGPSYAEDVIITQISHSGNSVTYEFTPAAHATMAEFSDSMGRLRLSFPEYFSGRITVNGLVEWSETTTPTTHPGDAEVDLTDNTASQSFQRLLTIRPIAEADLTVTAFVRSDDMAGSDVVAGSPTSVTGSATDGQSVTIAQILELRESTTDGSGPGGAATMLDQVEVYLGFDASTPDTDGSEELETLTIDNIPSGWLPEGWEDGAVPSYLWYELRTPDGSALAPASEIDKIASITIDAATGQMIITFKDDVTSFEAALPLQPDTYEDWDPDQTPPFDIGGAGGTAQGTFYGGDISVRLETRDSNTVTTDTETAEVEVDIDVAPINNFSYLVSYHQGNEGEIDATNTGHGGRWNVDLMLDTNDQDGSESVTAVVIRSLSNAFTVYHEIGNTGVFVPAEITSINGDGTVDWSLSNGNWETLQLRRIPMHFAANEDSGGYPLVIDVVTTEHDGGGTGTTRLNVDLHVDPVADGGTPSGHGTGYE
ncbi:MAG: hypothetical protein ACK5JR_16530, partial [Tropicimonas sp.]